ncbi:MAG TPA: DoxX family protein [Rhodanobacteraceae bacterium]|jgi:putative oxidoreductase|nr:DoxX family protein [Rhodanobacteraceae bacterium]
MRSFVILLGRIGLALIFILSGVGKLRGYDATVAMMVAHNLPAGLLPVVIFAELGGGLAILFGFLTRVAAVGLFVFTLLAAAFFHDNFADPLQLLNFEKNIAIAGGFLVLAACGPGRVAVDALWHRRRRRGRERLSF